jgi:hypothetical protein
LTPKALSNLNQRNLINKFYEPVFEEYNLSKVTIPKFYHSELNSEERRQDILGELFNSQAKTLILFGDLPIKLFLNILSIQNITD